MKGLKAAWRVGWRVALCAFLLAWIFQSIFLSAGKDLRGGQGLDWDQLARLEQWRIAWTAGPRELWQHAQPGRSPWRWPRSLLCVLLTILLNVARWRLVLKVQGLHLPWGRATGITFVAQFFNAFLLGSTGGDVIKALYAARETHHKKAEAVVTVFVDRLLGLWAMLLFAALMMIPNASLLSAPPRTGRARLDDSLMLGGASVVLGVAFWSGLSRRFPRARHLLAQTAQGRIAGTLPGCLPPFRHEPGIPPPKTLGLSLLVNLACVLQMIVLSAGLGVSVSSWAWLVIVPDDLLHLRPADHPQRAGRAGKPVCPDAGRARNCRPQNHRPLPLPARLRRQPFLEPGRRHRLSQPEEETTPGRSDPRRKRHAGGRMNMGEHDSNAGFAPPVRWAQIWFW